MNLFEKIYLVLMAWTSGFFGMLTVVFVDEGMRDNASGALLISILFAGVVVFMIVGWERSEERRL